MRFALALAFLALPGLAAAAGCKARSGEKTVALVELYTSEGCNSCPPADRWLSGLAGRGYGAERVVPLALHVDYWDYIGWKDPYAKREFSQRQRKLSQLQRMALVYTPQVVLQGRDFPRWGSGVFDATVAAINARPAKARIALEILGRTSAALDAQARAELADPAQSGHAALYLAVYENRLSSRITAGENSGRTLTHDHVVLEWQGPFAFGPGGTVSERRALTLLPKGVPERSGVVGFVQDRRTGEVLQALLLSSC
ncbi:MAG: hypothetical protein QOD26_2914 [Betaproteobacteria bacterium]|jgi:hypothetical protein|nr:hypothetical protein [Betaproteobacteria bacterium]